MVAEETAAGTLSPSAVRRHAIILGTILGAAVDDTPPRLVRNPVRGVKLPLRWPGRCDSSSLSNSRPSPTPILCSTGPTSSQPATLVSGGASLSASRSRTSTSCGERSASSASCSRSGAPCASDRRTRAGVRTVTMPRALGEILAEHFASGAGAVLPARVPRAKGRPAAAVELPPGLDEGSHAGRVRRRAARWARLPRASAHGRGARDRARRPSAGHQGTARALLDHGHDGRIRGPVPCLEEAIGDGLDAVLRESLAGPTRDGGETVARLCTSEG